MLSRFESREAFVKEMKKFGFREVNLSAEAERASRANALEVVGSNAGDDVEDDDADEEEGAWIRAHAKKAGAAAGSGVGPADAGTSAGNTHFFTCAFRKVGYCQRDATLTPKPCIYKRR